LVGKGTLLPPRVAALRAQSKEKRKLMKQIRMEDKKKAKRKPKISNKKQKKS